MSKLSHEQALGNSAVLRDRLDGDFVIRGERGYDEARAAVNLPEDARPVAVALPRSTGDVAAVLRFARAHGFDVAAADGAGPLHRTIVVSTRAVPGVEIRPLGRAA